MFVLGLGNPVQPRETIGRTQRPACPSPLRFLVRFGVKEMKAFRV